MAAQPVPSLKRAPIRPSANIPSVLIVDDDPQAMAEGIRVLDELGYDHRSATSAREALVLLAQDQTIGIMLASAELPAMDGPALVEEMRMRSGGKRSCSAILASARASTDLAIRAMRAGAVDCVTWPYAVVDLPAALHRALDDRAGHWIAPPAASPDVANQLSQILAMLEAQSPAPVASREIGAREIAATLRAIIASRTLRSRHFPSELFADPAWDILLDLTRAELDRQTVSVSSVCIAASVPMSTALRWVRQMTEAGLLQRWTDPRDKRRDLIALTEPTAASMRNYLAAACTTLRKI